MITAHDIELECSITAPCMYILLLCGKCKRDVACDMILLACNMILNGEY